MRCCSLSAQTKSWANRLNGTDKSTRWRLHEGRADASYCCTFSSKTANFSFDTAAEPTAYEVLRSPMVHSKTVESLKVEVLVKLSNV